MEDSALDGALTGLLPRRCQYGGGGLEEMSDGTSSASESSVDRAPPPPKKLRPGRKPVGRHVAKRAVTYYKRKDEIQELHDQIQQLQAKLKQAELKNPTVQESMAALHASSALHELFTSGLEHNSMVLAGTQSMLSHYNLSMVNVGAASPLSTAIHLPVEAARRTQTLSSIRDAKLQAAFRFMAERTRFLDLSRGHRQGESFDLPNGELNVTGLDVIHYHGGHSLRQVYEALQAFISHQEISVSEKLGILTIRLEIESNAVVFASVVEPTDTSPAFGIATIDFVDQDDLFPYRPDECGRKDVTGAILLTEVSTATGRSVAMTRWSSVKFRPPSFPVTKAVEAAVRERVLTWCELMPKAMREWLATHPPAE